MGRVGVTHECGDPGEAPPSKEELRAKARGGKKPCVRLSQWPLEQRGVGAE